MSDVKEYRKQLNEIFDNLKSNVDKIFDSYKEKLNELEDIEQDAK